MTSCGAVIGGQSLDDVDVSSQAVIQGIVQRAGQPVSVGYVRLLDSNEEFVAEVPVSDKGEFRFFATTGSWTLSALVPGASVRKSVSAVIGEIVETTVEVS